MKYQHFFFLSSAWGNGEMSEFLAGPKCCDSFSCDNICSRVLSCCLPAAVFMLKQVPVVAVMTTGGGTRALTSLLGNLLGLQKLDLLDAISYITGSSGSTW